MNCPYCTSNLSAGTNFCGKCGNRLPDHLLETSKKPGSSGGLIVSLIIFLLVAGGGALGYLYFSGDQQIEKLKPEVKPVEEEPPPKPLEKEQEVPMPDAESSPPQEEQVQMPDAESPPPQQEEVTTPSSEDAETSDPMRITADVVQPVLIHKVQPEYPEIARKARIQGVVILEAIITKEGNVENVKVLRRLHPILDQAAVNSVQQWHYKPATLNGRPVKVYSTVTVKFTLK